MRKKTTALTLDEQQKAKALEEAVKLKEEQLAEREKIKEEERAKKRTAVAAMSAKSEARKQAKQEAKKQRIIAKAESRIRRAEKREQRERELQLRQAKERLQKQAAAKEKEKKHAAKIAERENRRAAQQEKINLKKQEKKARMLEAKRAVKAREQEKIAAIQRKRIEMATQKEEAAKLREFRQEVRRNKLYLSKFAFLLKIIDPFNYTKLQGKRIFREAKELTDTMMADLSFADQKSIAERAGDMFVSDNYKAIVQYYKDIEKAETKQAYAVVIGSGISVLLTWIVFFFADLPFALFLGLSLLWVVLFFYWNKPRYTGKKFREEIIEPLCSACAGEKDCSKYTCTSDKVSYSTRSKERKVAYYRFFFSNSKTKSIEIEKILQRETLPTYRQIGNKLLFGNETSSVFSGFVFNQNKKEIGAKGWTMVVCNENTYKKMLRPFEGMQPVVTTGTVLSPEWELLLENTALPESFDLEKVAAMVDEFGKQVGAFDLYANDTAMQLMLPTYSIRDAISITPFKSQLKDKWFMAEREFVSLAKFVYITGFINRFRECLITKEVDRDVEQTEEQP